jgi:glutathione S-transferase
VPVLLDGDSPVVDSWTIANHLEDSYPDRPSLFGGEGGRAMARMLNWWGDGVIGGMFPLIIADIPLNLNPADAAYFRKSREARFGKPLEEIMAGRDKAVEGFRKSLDPLRLTLRTQPFIGGAAANYADYIVFGAFQWGRVVSPFKLLMEDDPVYGWRGAAARRVRRAGAEVAKLSRLASAAGIDRWPALDPSIDAFFEIVARHQRGELLALDLQALTDSHVQSARDRGDDAADRARRMPDNAAGQFARGRQQRRVRYHSIDEADLQRALR